MAGFTLKLASNSAFNAIRNSGEVTAVIEELAHEIADRANAETAVRVDPGEDPFAVDIVHNRSRAVAFVRAANLDGMLAEARDRTLSKAIR